MRRGLLAAAVMIGWLMAGQPLGAHHSFAAQYDATKTITLTGTVTKVEWANPHIYFHLDVKDAAGVVTAWALEGGAPNQLYRNGWRKDSLKTGDVVTVQAFLARDGSHLANMRIVTLADGKRIFSAADTP